MSAERAFRTEEYNRKQENGPSLISVAFIKMNSLHVGAVLPRSVAQCGGLKHNFKSNSTTPSQRFSAYRRQCLHHTTQSKLRFMTQFSFGTYLSQKFGSLNKNNIFRCTAASAETSSTNAQDMIMPLVYDGVIFDMVRDLSNLYNPRLFLNRAIFLSNEE